MEKTRRMETRMENYLSGDRKFTNRVDWQGQKDTTGKEGRKK